MLCAVLRRAYDWFSGLNLAQKALALLFAGLFLFSLSYLLTTTVLSLAAGDRADSPVEEGAAPNTGTSASAGTTVPDNRLSLAGARWEGQKAVLKGTWKGDVSSVHCDLLEGGASGRSTRWWDRSVGTQMDWSDRTFTQEFVAAEGDGGSLEPEASYGVVCSAQFSGGWSVSDSTPVEGTPPG
ncbi:MAG: hypothetical protein K0S10_297 [Rubrobacteraceae bacterium]|nr:hypothetical protein [Rubrobacteraceae bacterium]